MNYWQSVCQAYSWHNTQFRRFQLGLHITNRRNAHCWQFLFLMYCHLEINVWWLAVMLISLWIQKSSKARRAFENEHMSKTLSSPNRRLNFTKLSLTCRCLTNYELFRTVSYFQPLANPCRLNYNNTVYCLMFIRISRIYKHLYHKNCVICYTDLYNRHR